MNTATNPAADLSAVTYPSRVSSQTSYDVRFVATAASLGITGPNARSFAENAAEAAYNALVDVYEGAEVLVTIVFDRAVLRPGEQAGIVIVWSQLDREYEKNYEAAAYVVEVATEAALAMVAEDTVIEINDDLDWGIRQAWEAIAFAA